MTSVVVTTEGPDHNAASAPPGGPPARCSTPPNAVYLAAVAVSNCNPVYPVDAYPQASAAEMDRELR